MVGAHEKYVARNEACCQDLQPSHVSPALRERPKPIEEAYVGLSPVSLEILWWLENHPCPHHIDRTFVNSVSYPNSPAAISL